MGSRIEFWLMSIGCVLRTSGSLWGYCSGLKPTYAAFFTAGHLNYFSTNLNLNIIQVSWFISFSCTLLKPIQYPLTLYCSLSFSNFLSPFLSFFHYLLCYLSIFTAGQFNFFISALFGLVNLYISHPLTFSLIFISSLTYL